MKERLDGNQGSPTTEMESRSKPAGKKDGSFRVKMKSTKQMNEQRPVPLLK